MIDHDALKPGTLSRITELELVVKSLQRQVVVTRWLTVLAMLVALTVGLHR